MALCTNRGFVTFVSRPCAYCWIGCRTCRHDATFHGEDLEMGYITHKLSGRNKLEGGKEGVDTNHRIALMKDCFVPTTVCYSIMAPPHPTNRRTSAARALAIC
jgi:hypothetical protein